jgi:predicted transcriptional regulator
MPISQRPRVRRGSVPVAKWQRQHLGHRDRVQAMDRARRFERETYRRGRGLHGGYLKETGLKVFHYILYRGQGRAGALDPSHGQIAEGTRLARSTVQLAVQRLQAAGFLWRVMRRREVNGISEQATNAYVLLPADAQMTGTDGRAALDSLSTKEEEHPPAPPINEAARADLGRKWQLEAMLEPWPVLQPA